jgi:hypothetical protein
MIYWLQEATTAGGQGGGPSWLLSAGVIGAVVSLIGLILAQLRHTQTLRQTRELEDTRRVEARELEAQRAHEAALQRYVEQVGKLLSDQQLRSTPADDRLRAVARAHTLAVLEGLDPDRKRILLQFLHESKLIHLDKPIISLLEANLKGANLIEADLSEANLSRANLSRANLSRANLRGATLGPSNLSEASLIEASLIEADLRGAILSNTYLRNVELHMANLSEAKYLTQEQLDQATGDENTKLPAHLERPAHWKRSSSEEGEQ